MLVLQSITFSGATSEYCQSFISGFAPRFSFSGNLSLFRDKQVFPEDWVKKIKLLQKRRKALRRQVVSNDFFQNSAHPFVLKNEKKSSSYKRNFVSKQRKR